ncbi:MAG: hypothetical protein J6Q13_03520 [Clostridia bacterium]|nr:hypothetical protein [Clostridia bacterium]
MKKFLCLILLLMCPILLSACSNDGMIERDITSVKVRSEYQGGWVTYNQVDKVVKLDDNIVEIYLQNGEVITTSINNVIIYSK